LFCFPSSLFEGRKSSKTITTFSRRETNAFFFPRRGTKGNKTLEEKNFVLPKAKTKEETTKEKTNRTKNTNTIKKDFKIIFFVLYNNILLLYILLKILYLRKYMLLVLKLLIFLIIQGISNNFLKESF
jgi:hypothetical protein